MMQLTAAIRSSNSFGASEDGEGSWMMFKDMCARYWVGVFRHTCEHFGCKWEWGWVKDFETRISADRDGNDIGALLVAILSTYSTYFI